MFILLLVILVASNKIESKVGRRIRLSLTDSEVSGRSGKAFDTKPINYDIINYL